MHAAIESVSRLGINIPLAHEAAEGCLDVTGRATKPVVQVKMAEGSVQTIEEIPAALRNVYRTVWEIPMRSLIDMGADRGPFIDQSQSLNLFFETPTIGQTTAGLWRSQARATRAGPTPASAATAGRARAPRR